MEHSHRLLLNLLSLIVSRPRGTSEQKSKINIVYYCDFYNSCAGAACNQKSEAIKIVAHKVAQGIFSYSKVKRHAYKEWCFYSTVDVIDKETTSNGSVLSCYKQVYVVGRMQ